MITLSEAGITAEGHSPSLLLDNCFYSVVTCSDNLHSCCSYDFVFEDDTARRNTDRRKVQKVDDQRSQLPPRGDRDRNSSRERSQNDEKTGRQSKEGVVSRGGRRPDDQHSHDRTGGRGSGRHDDRDYSKQHSRGRNMDDGEEDYKRRSIKEGHVYSGVMDLWHARAAKASLKMA